MLDQSVDNKSLRISTYSDFVLVVPVESERITQLEEFKSQMQLMGQYPSHLIVNCMYMKSISRFWIDSLSVLGKQLVSLKKKIMLINVSKSHENEIKEFGEDVHFEIAADLLCAIENLRSTMETREDIHFIHAVVNATMKTIFVQGKTLCKKGKIYIKESDANILEGDISSMINVISNWGAYVILISFPEKTFLNLMSKIFDEKFEKITDEIKDGVMELMNIIYGQAKVGLNKNNAGLRPEIPVLVMGQEFPGDADERAKTVTNSFEKGRNIIVPYVSDLGEFSIRIWFEKEQQTMVLNG